MIAAKQFFPGACVVKVMNLLKNGYHFVHGKTFFIILRYYTTQPKIKTDYSSKTKLAFSAKFCKYLEGVEINQQDGLTADLEAVQPA